ncbi:MAG: hypothetical protein EOO37_02620 [Cytophagaceae bacterium]|nr:MAG: hypothetical protein EOO37_02620 [Cytophagaceae bacterium]
MLETNQETKLAGILDKLIEVRKKYSDKAQALIPIGKAYEATKFESPVLSFADLQKSWNAEQNVKDKVSESKKLEEAINQYRQQIDGFLPEAVKKHLDKIGSYLVVKQADNSVYALFKFSKNYDAVWAHNVPALADEIKKFRTNNTKPGPDLSGIYNMDIRDIYQ